MSDCLPSAALISRPRLCEACRCASGGRWCAFRLKGLLTLDALCGHFCGFRGFSCLLVAGTLIRVAVATGQITRQTVFLLTALRSVPAQCRDGSPRLAHQPHGGISVLARSEARRLREH